MTNNVSLPHMASKLEGGLLVGMLPDEIRLDKNNVGKLWQLHPEDFHEIQIHGRLVKTPRWQQAFGADYHYTGRTNKALPVPGILKPIHAWCKSHIDDRLNGLLVNWYDGKLGHYIGKHRDSTKNMCVGAPIVTISFGEERTFRVRRWKATERHDYQAVDGSIFVMGYETNLAWTHEVPKSTKYKGRRVSVTLRAFETE